MKLHNLCRMQVSFSLFQVLFVMVYFGFCSFSRFQVGFQVWFSWFQVDFYRHKWFQVGLNPSWAPQARSETLRSPHGPVMMMMIYILWCSVCVSVCHEKSSLPTSEMSAKGAKWAAFGLVMMMMMMMIPLWLNVTQLLAQQWEIWRIERKYSGSVCTIVCHHISL